MCTKCGDGGACGDGGGRNGGREREGRAGHLLTW